MSILIVGAGAAGGYIGAQLAAADRDVTVLVHPRALDRLTADGLRIRLDADVHTTSVRAVTMSGLRGPYDVVIVAVRASAVGSAINDVRGAVGADTRIVPVMNGMRHLSLLTAAFGPDRTLGAATRLIASMSADGTINVVNPGIDMQIGQLDRGESDALRRTVTALEVPGITVTARRDVVSAMWEKFVFIASTAVLTCLVGDEVGPIARADGGIALARRVLAEVAAVAAADGYPLDDATRSGVDATVTDTSSTFGPSMFRDMRAGRPIERSVLEDLAERAHSHGIDTPLLAASLVVIDVHNRG